MILRLVCLLLVLFPTFAWTETLGELRIEDLTLRPQGYLREPQSGGFSLGESSASLGYQFDHVFSASFRVGAHSLLARPHFYQITKDDDELDLLEAYAEVNGVLGQLRVGLIPLELTVDAQKSDGQLIFSRSLIYSKGLVGLRDMGARYLISYNHFFTSVAIHNGEGKSDLDNRTWYSATWGYDFHKLRVAAFGQTGSTKPISTTGSTLTVAGFDPSMTSKWRIGGLFANWTPSKFEMTMEAIVGDKEQDQSKKRFVTGHLDMGQIGEKGYGGFFRYNIFDPNLDVHNDAEHKLSLALVWANGLKTSKLILIGSKVLEEKTQTQNDELQLVWSLTPQIQ